MTPKRINAEGSDSILADLDVPKSFMSPRHPVLILLLAILLARKTPVLLPNNKPATLALFNNEYDEVVRDIKVKTTLLHKDLALNLCLSMLQEIVIFTSGSSGRPKKIVKSLRAIYNEVSALEVHFGNDVLYKSILTNVAPNHMYGLTFFVFWPLVARRQIICDDIHFTEDFTCIAQRQNNILFITSPSFLARLLQTLDKQSLFPNVTLVSAGGFLDQKIASTLSTENYPKFS